LKSVVAIRTNRWTAEERGLYARLHAVFGDDVHVVFHNRPEGVQPEAHVVDIDTAWVESHGLRGVRDWGWCCGDYFYYALRKAVPDADFYWLIEPDVFFTTDPHSFFERCAADPSDALALDIAPFLEHNRFARGLREMAHFRAIFAMTRLSGRVLDRLLKERQAYSQRELIERAYTNDEIFVFSHLAAMQGATQGNLRDLAPDWFDQAQFNTNPDILDIELTRNGLVPGRVWHPVRSVDHFKSSVAERLATSTSFLPRMAPSLRALEDADIEDIVTQAADELRKTLYRVRG